MIQLGLIRNPRSRRNRGGGDEFRDRASVWLGHLFAEPQSRADLLEILRDFARREVGLVVIDGGDGTVREILTALPLAFGEALPAVTILASGNANLIAADVGSGGRGPRALQTLLRSAAQGRLGRNIRRRPVIEISWPEDEGVPLRGMFFGAGAFTRSIALAQSQVLSRGVSYGPSVALTIISSVAKVLRGPDREAWLAGLPMALAADGVDGPPGNRFVVLATTLHKLIFGIWPFWNEGPAPLHYLDVAGRPARLVSAALSLLRGRPAPWLQGAPDYRSGSATVLDLSLRDPFVLDGELYQPGANGRIQVRSGPLIDFVVP